MKKTFYLLAAGLGAALSGPALADHLNIAVEGVTVEGSDVTFPSVLIDKDGFVVLHQVENGEIVLPQSIGHAAVAAGTTENVKLTADTALEEGREYHAMIHYDTNGNGEYEFGEGSTDIDTPGMRPDGTAYGKMFSAGGM
jgi:hypothetical protein